jgi:hypothetical protein
MPAIIRLRVFWSTTSGNGPLSFLGRLDVPPRECARLMGFEKKGGKAFKIVVSDTQAYRQFGNAVVVPAVEAVAELMLPWIVGHESSGDGGRTALPALGVRGRSGAAARQAAMRKPRAGIRSA